MKKSLISIALLTALSATTSIANANNAGDIIARVGATHVAASNDQPTIYAAGMTVHLAADGPAFEASVGNDTSIGLNLAYFIKVPS